MEPKVSVIIPTYNRVKFLKEALDSLVEQTFKNFDVIVVDDGSFDSIEGIIKQVEGKINLKTLRSDENQGVSWARNQGIQESKAPWIAFLDSDDLWHPRKLEVQLAFLDKNPDIQICQTEEIWVRDGKRVNPMKKHIKSGGNIFSRCLELCVVSPSATIMSRKLLEEVGPFDESLPACEDYDMWLRVSYRYPIALIDEPLITKRGGHDDQLSQKYPAMDYYRIQAIKKLLMEAPLDEKQGAQAIEALREKCMIYASGARKRGKHQEASNAESIIAEYTKNL